VPTRENLSKDIEIKVIPNKKPIELWAFCHFDAVKSTKTGFFKGHVVSTFISGFPEVSKKSPVPKILL
jgi:hypothetical protein